MSRACKVYDGWIPHACCDNCDNMDPSMVDMDGFYYEGCALDGHRLNMLTSLYDICEHWRLSPLEYSVYHGTRPLLKSPAEQARTLQTSLEVWILD